MAHWSRSRDTSKSIVPSRPCPVLRRSHSLAGSDGACGCAISGHGAERGIAGQYGGRYCRVMPLMNTEGFGKRIRSLRENVLELSRDGLADLGGLSETDQGRIENGEPVELTNERLSRIEKAFTSAAPSAFDSATRSFLEALATIYQAAGQMPHLDQATLASRLHSGEGMYDPSRQVSAALAVRAADWGTAADEFLLGAELVPDQPLGGALIGAGAVYASAALGGAMKPLGKGGFEEASGSAKGRYWQEQARTANNEFRFSALHVAARYPGAVTVRQDDAIVDEATAYWSAHRQNSKIYRRSESLIDPLSGVRNLQEARRRADALDVDNEQDRFHLAWLILLANATAGRTNSPFSVWLTDARYNTPQTAAESALAYQWTKAHAHLPEKIRASFPTLSELKARAGRYLEPFMSHTSDPLWDLEFQIGDEGESIWSTGTDAGGELITPQEGDLLIYQPGAAPTDAEKRVSAGHPFPRIVADLGVRNVQLSATSIRLTGARQARKFDWCPSGVNRAYALVRDHAQNLWYPVQMF